MFANNLPGGVMDPQVFANMQALHLAEERKGVEGGAADNGGGEGAQRERSDEEQRAEYQRMAAEQKQKERDTQILQGLAALGANRGVPVRNMYQDAGRTGLVDPGLTQQQTTQPLPFNDAYNTTANLLGMINAMPPQLKGSSDQIVGTVETTLPQMQRALVQPSTIYEVVPQNFLTNRLNLALQRHRETSIYAVV